MIESIIGAWLAFGYIIVIYLCHKKTPTGLHFMDFFWAIGASVLGPIWFYEVFRKNENE